MYFGPRYLSSAWHTSTMTAEAVFTATPKVLVVILRVPVSCKKYSVNGNIVADVKAL